MIRWEVAGPYEVVFSTRLGGVSEGAFASLNLGLLTGDEPALVEENRRRLCGEIGADPARLALSRQMHGAEVHRARPGRGTPGDALFTEQRGLPMLRLTADCLPIAVACSNGHRPALALVHAGWRGLLCGVVEKAVAAVGGHAVAIVGPGIGPCCYEVGDEVAMPFRERYGGSVLRGHSLDLPAAAEDALRSAGCASVERLDICTSCHADLFFSHRRDGERTGRQGVIGVIRSGV